MQTPRHILHPLIHAICNYINLVLDIKKVKLSNDINKLFKKFKENILPQFQCSHTLIYVIVNCISFQNILNKHLKHFSSNDIP